MSAANALRKRNAILTAKEADGEVVIDARDVDSSARSLAVAIQEYLGEVKAAKSHKTHVAYSTVLQGFSTSCRSATLEGLTRGDVINYIGSLRQRGMSQRTIANWLSYVKTFFLHFDVEWPLLKTDRVRYTEKTVEAYSTEDGKGLFAAADQDETDLFQFLLCTGVRDQEAMHASCAMWTSAGRCSRSPRSFTRSSRRRTKRKAESLFLTPLCSCSGCGGSGIPTHA